MLELLAVVTFLSSILISFFVSKEFALVVLGTITFMFFHQNILVGIPILPNPSIYQIVLIGIFLTSFFYIFTHYQFSFTDILVLCLVCINIYSQVQSAYSPLTKTIVATSTLQILLPYILYKTFLKKEHYLVLFLKTMVYSTIIIILIGFWEVRMTQNVFVYIAKNLAPNFYYSIPKFRWGIVRLHGPFGGHIISGLMIGLAYLMHVILSKGGLWKRYFSVLPINKPIVFYVLLSIGILMPISRIAVFSLVVSLLFFFIINGKIFTVKKAIPLFLIILITGSGLNYYYTTISSQVTIAESGLESSTRARNIKMNQLLPVIKENFYLGVGNKGHLAETKESPIDNSYLFIAYERGVPAMIVFILIGAIQFTRLVIRGRKYQKDYPIDAIFSFGFAVIIFFLYSSLTQVVLFRSLGVIFYGLVGVFEAHILAKKGYLDNSEKLKKFTNKKTKKTLTKNYV